MSKHHSHIASTVRIVESYRGEEPFVYFIKKYFSANKKFGSKDRRMISALCYNYFRTGRSLAEKSTEQRIILSFFLCETTASDLLEVVAPDLNTAVSKPLNKKLQFAEGFDAGNIFPFSKELSKEINEEAFSHSFLTQPKLFLRIRPGRKDLLLEKMTAAGILFELENDETLALKNTTSVSDTIAINRDAVIQDRSSQQVLNYLDGHAPMSPVQKLSAWDCCAASGGKSILLYDKLKGKVQLTVSDIRRSILHNCEKRLQQARVDIYKSFVADLTQKDLPDFTDKFPVIICDAPCTGSGTWGRTPEQLLFFKENIINEYVKKQQQIALHAVKHLQQDGLFFYITCSVFTKENEDIVAFLQKETGCKILQQQYYKGYENQADTMFSAVLTK